MMRVLGNEPMHSNHDAAQFWRGASLYARQNRWTALAVIALVVYAVYTWEIKADARWLLLLSLDTFILMFWWIFDPATKRNGFGYKIGFLGGMGAVSDEPVLALFFAILIMAWPWIEQVKTPKNFLNWAIGGTAAFIVIFFSTLFISWQL